ncbi:MAG: cation-translocating P-type ATPase [Candidatus Melainabacteria bacterium]|nr:cation-translocating P-type ATPase [Candidatus Melainabacteria bacterium]
MSNQLTDHEPQNLSSDPRQVSEGEELAEAPIDDILRLYKSNLRTGLDEETANQKLIESGRNEITFKKQDGLAQLLFRQFQSSVVILLLVAAVVSFCTGDHLQAIGILTAVIINAAVGFLTEMKSQMSLIALQQMSGPSARVVRSSHHRLIPAPELVEGDIVILEPGSRIPADLRFVEAAALQVDESILTGESVSVAKAASPVEGEKSSITLGFHGTHVVNGRARGVVISTGKKSSLGKLQCSLMEGHAVPTPLEVKLEELGKQLSQMTVFICVAIAIVGLVNGENIWSMLETSIALAVAAIPEGLPVVATLALAIGTQRMVKAGALIRQLSAVETLGCTNIICSDKTGTLTENKLLVTDIYVDGTNLKVSGIGYAPEGVISKNGQCDYQSDILTQLLKATTLCNDARLEHNEKENLWHIAGDPTEGALLVAASKAGLDHRDLRETHPRIGEIPFDLIRKKMTTFHKIADQQSEAYVKGSPEHVIADSKFVHRAEGVVRFTDEMKQEYLSANCSFAENGLRVLGVAMKRLDSTVFDTTSGAHDTNLVFLGLIAMKDLARQGVETAIDRCRDAGIRVMMLTGDQKETAKSIAVDLHILEKDHLVVSGDELIDLNKQQFALKLQSSDVLARVTPSLKLDVVKALQQGGNVVAMTGDGVNDAPALQQANIGIAMGLSGTDLAREASNMVITDDNFSTIVKAVEQGRIIYDNIRRSICYLLTASVASVMSIALVIVTTSILALNPLQLLWLNLIMHVFPGLGIVLQGAAPGTMQRSPRNPLAKLIGRFELVQILFRASLVSVAVLACVLFCRHEQTSAETLSTMALATISFGLLYQAWNWLFVKTSIEESLGLAPINKFMYLMMFISYSLVFVAIYMPALQPVLRTVALTAQQLMVVLLISTASAVASIFVERLWSLVAKRLNKTAPRE